MDAGRDLRLAAMEERHRSERRGALWTVLFFLACMAFGVWWRVSVWNECRAEGHSRMYCWSLAAGR